MEQKIINILVAEHEELLSFLKELDELNNQIQDMTEFSHDNNEFIKLKELANHLLDAENHHQREEQVLFPELESRNITGPTRVMCLEHEELRVKKRQLLELAENVSNMKFKKFKKELDQTTKFIVLALENHIYKENNILYPAALRVIQEKDVWEEMEIRCDKIGYCGFTPSV